MAILIIEDDVEIGKSIVDGLGQNHFECRHVVSGNEGINLALNNHFQMIIVDLMLPDIDGLEIISRLRQNNIQVPVLILSAKRSLDERVLGLQKGGDDYMVKPFAFVELLARVNSLIRRTATPAVPTTIQFEDLKVNLVTREVFRKGQAIELQAKEFLLLELFIKNQKVPLSKTQILENIWGYNFDPQTNVVDVLVYRLRNKIDKGFSVSYLHTIRGIGYVLKSE
ncbi:MAG: response regulator transcription factor [Pseudobdellovibrio sp.]